MASRLAVLEGRRIVEVRGADAASFLQRLLTNDVEALQPGEVRYAALLTPQGKIVADFLAFRTADGYLLDTPASVADELVKRLQQYRLRAKVEVVDRSDGLASVAYPPGEAPDGAVVSAADPRDTTLWARAILPHATLPPAAAEADAARDAVRLAAGVPEGGLDFAYGDAFPHEANLDHLNGVNYGKGCYVGQEVVSRVHHRGTARKRIARVTFEGAAPPPGTPILAGDMEVGVMGSAAAGQGLASVRVDRVREASGPLTANAATLSVHLPDWAQG